MSNADTMNVPKADAVKIQVFAFGEAKAVIDGMIFELCDRIASAECGQGEGVAVHPTAFAIGCLTMARARIDGRIKEAEEKGVLF